jgi:exodeoxyribonuclease III
LWNVNGLSSRWKGGDVALGADEQPDAPPSMKQRKKKRQYARKNDEADFRAIILRSGSPDLVTIIESKLSLNKMISLPGFINWCENMNYHFISLSYSSSDVKGGAGYAGVMTLSKYLPTSTTFDLEGLPTNEARVITHEFESFLHVSVYSPCSGYDPIKMDNRLRFDAALTSHITKQKLKCGKPVICSGDLNVNPRRQDWHENAFISMFKLKEKSGSKYHPGYSPSELKSYHNLLTTAKLTNAWEELYPYSDEGMTWHPPTDPQGEKGWGQRLDHFLISKDFLSNHGEYTLISMINLRGEGSSDHNALLLNLQLTSELSSVAILNERDNTDVVISNLDTNKSGTFKVAECPRITILVADKPTQIFLDTGAPFSIYNPPAKRPVRDFYMEAATPTGSLVNCSFTGATGGRVTADQNYVLPFKVGKYLLHGNFVVLKTHERNLPLFLFGQDLLMGPLEGIAVIPDVKHQMDKISVYFGIDWANKHPCEAILQIKHPPKLPQDVTCLLQDLDVDLIAKYLPQVNNINPEKLFVENCLDRDAFVFGGNMMREEHLENEDEEEGYYPQDEFCNEIDGMGQGFQECPIPVVEIALVFQNLISTLTVKILIVEHL